jgi:hypothetical protein
MSLCSTPWGTHTSHVAPPENSALFAAASRLNHLLKICHRETRISDRSGVYEGLRRVYMLLRKDVIDEGEMITTSQLFCEQWCIIVELAQFEKQNIA